MRTYRPFIAAMTAGLFVAGLVSCSVVQKGTEVLAGSGKTKGSDTSSLVKTTQALRSTFSQITDEEEYYIGRAVAALILSRYKVYENTTISGYLNVLGKAISYASDRPETYAGYHFLLLDSDEINAMAAPGGFVFITRGLLKRCRDEDMLAAVVAHEIGHVSAKHGLQSIKKSRLMDAFGIIGKQAVEHYGSKELAQLTSVFEGALGDIVDSLVVKGYDRKYEYQADQLAVLYASRMGYDPNGITRFLKTLVGDSSSATGKGWFRTHPSPEDRIEKAKSQIGKLGRKSETLQIRTQRFSQSVKGLR